MRGVVRRFRLTLSQRKSLMFYVFTLPFTIGFVFVFLYPFMQTVAFSLSELLISRDGYTLNYLGLSNYHHCLFVDPDFVRTLIGTMGNLLGDLPSILVFSFVSACALNSKFKGRFLARTIFFLPVIMGSGIILQLEKTDYMATVFQQGLATGDSTELISNAAMVDFLMMLKLPHELLTYVINASNYLADTIRSSGIQILVFLAGLQSIPPSLYEAADVEGCTKWESFWLITLPMMSPLILTNIVYTVVDSFTAGDNQMAQLIRATTFSGRGYGASTAMSVMYSAAIAIVLVVVIGIVSRWVYYDE